MRQRAVIFFGFILSAVAQVSFSQGTAHDTLSNIESPRDNFNYEVVVDAGYFPIKYNGPQEWQGIFSARVGGGKLFTKNLALHFFIDYYSYRWPASNPPNDYRVNSPNTIMDYSSRPLRRDEVALYWVITLGMIDIGVGANYSQSEWLPYAIVHGSYPQFSLSVGDRVSRFDVFLMIGLAYKIPIGDEFFVPFGLYFKDSGYDFSRAPLLLRIGIAKQF